MSDQKDDGGATGGTTGNDGGAAGNSGDGGSGATKRTLSEILSANPELKTEFDKELQKESDRRVQQALDTAAKKKAKKPPKKADDEGDDEGEPDDVKTALEEIKAAVAALQAEKEAESLSQKARAAGIPDALLPLIKAESDIAATKAAIPELLKAANKGTDLNPGKGAKDDPLPPEAEKFMKAVPNIKTGKPYTPDELKDLLKRHSARV